MHLIKTGCSHSIQIICRTAEVTRRYRINTYTAIYLHLPINNILSKLILTYILGYQWMISSLRIPDKVRLKLIHHLGLFIKKLFLHIV